MSYKLGQTTKVLAGIVPGALSAGTATAIPIDRQGFYDGIVHLKIGTSTGGPATQGVALKLQTGNMADYSDMADVPGDVIAALTANNAEAELNIDLNSYGRYLKAVPAVNFTGGTSPTIPVAVTVVLGNPVNVPV